MSTDFLLDAVKNLQLAVNALLIWENERQAREQLVALAASRVAEQLPTSCNEVATSLVNLAITKAVEQATAIQASTSKLPLGGQQYRLCQLLADGLPHDLDSVCRDLWPDLAPEKTMNRLESLVNRTRRSLESLPGSLRLVRDRGTLRLFKDQ